MSAPPVHPPTRKRLPVITCLVLGVAGLSYAVATGGLLGWIFAGFLGAGAFFYTRPQPGDMRRLATLIGIVVGATVLAGAGVLAAWESGEVVELRSRDDAGTWVSTRLWVLDLQGYPTVHSRPSARRTARMRADPTVELVRGGRAECRVAELISESDLPEEVLQEAARIAAEKYGFRLRATRVLAALLGGTPEEGILVRLKPCPGAR